MQIFIFDLLRNSRLVPGGAPAGGFFMGLRPFDPLKQLRFPTSQFFYYGTAPFPEGKRPKNILMGLNVLPSKNHSFSIALIYKMEI